MYGSLTSFQWRITLARQLLHSSRRCIQTSSVIYRGDVKRYKPKKKPLITDEVLSVAKDAVGSHEFYKSALSRQLRPWAHAPMTLGRFKALGVTQVESQMIQFAKFIYPELQKSGPLDEELWNPELITENMETSNFIRALDISLSGRFLAWITETLKGTPEGDLLINFRKAVDFRAYAWKYTDTRSMRRKIIMHVGPTNSGKTYNALRKLAASRTGFYAGPLRLLAHEVYDRLNRGLIPPHGQNSEGLFPKACNMQTGEEIRIVDPDAGIVSCTTEMLQLTRSYDVGVIDEVQLMADKQRGVAWTSAILGSMCSELHLCGEESAVPLVKSILADTADEIIVNKYRRLSPLKVDALSLNAKWRNVRKGDCVVTFSRGRIFELKQIIEKVTGLRCAVAYGSLPPEVRVEQATLFNNPDNGYDVMIASDAIGLGLNLKIKRIVFETVTKFDGMRDQQLTVSMIKQIGGRAGRYDPEATQMEPGLVTTYHPQDLPIVLKAMELPATPSLQRATLGLTTNIATDVAQYIPDHTSLIAVHDIIASCAQLGKNFKFQQLPAVMKMDDIMSDLTLEEKVLLAFAPTGKHQSVIDALRHYIQTYKTGGEVKYTTTLKDLGLLRELDYAKKIVNEVRATGLISDDANTPSASVGPSQTTQSSSEGTENSQELGISEETETLEEPKTIASATPSPSKATQSVQQAPIPRGLFRSLLLRLELLHQALSCYVWLSYRLMAFTQWEDAMKVKDENLRVMQTLLGLLARHPPEKVKQANDAREALSEAVPEFSRERVGQRTGFVSITRTFDSNRSAESAEKV